MATSTGVAGGGGGVPAGDVTTTAGEGPAAAGGGGGVPAGDGDSTAGVVGGGPGVRVVEVESLQVVREKNVHLSYCKGNLAEQYSITTGFLLAQKRSNKR